MASEGEMVMNNEASDMLGRKQLVAANKAGLDIRHGKSPKRHFKLGTAKAKKQGKPKGYADGVLSQQGVQMPKLGTTPPMQGIQRQGNSFSHIPGVTMPQSAPPPQPTVMAGYNTQGYADGTLESMGVQRQGNSYSKARTRPAPPQNMDTNSYPTTELGQANPVMPSTDHYQAMQDKVAGLRGGLYSAVGYADGTMDEGGVKPPGFMDTIKGILNAGDETQASNTQKTDLSANAPTLEQAKGNYELQNGTYEPQKFADGGIVRGLDYQDIINRNTGVTKDLANKSIPLPASKVTPNFTMPPNYTGTIPPGSQVAVIPQPKQSYSNPNFTGNDGVKGRATSAEGRAWTNKPKFETSFKDYSGGGGASVGGKAMRALGGAGSLLGVADVASEDSGRDQYLRLMAEKGNPDAQRIMAQGGSNPIANTAKEAIRSAPGYVMSQLGEMVQPATAQAPQAPQGQPFAPTGHQFGDFPIEQSPAEVARANNGGVAPNNPPVQSINLEHENGVNTLSGNGYSVSSKSKNLGTHSTPESLAQLDSTIAYNSRPEVRAKYQANADAYYANEAQKAEQARLANLEDIALNGGGRADQSFTDMFANNKRQKAAQAILGINTDAGLKRQGLGIEQQKLAQNQNQFEASGKAASSKAEQDYKVELGKLGLDLQKLDRTEYGMTTDPNTGEQVSYPKAGKGADINFQVQSEYANRMNHKNYKDLVDKLGQQQADALFMQKAKDYYYGLAKQAVATK